MPGCPWYQAHMLYPPNVDWCEQKVCSIFMTPFNTLTNLAFMLLGLYIWSQMKKSPSKILRFFGIAMYTVGFTSLIYHASLNFYTQVLDFIGMYMFCVLLIMCNRSRGPVEGRTWPAPPRTFYRFWIWVLGITVLTTVSGKLIPHFPIQIFVLLLIFEIIRTEFKKTAPSRKFFWMSFASLVVAATFSALDAARILCFSENHFFQGHGMWHVFSAIALYFSFRHIRQFENELY